MFKVANTMFTYHVIDIIIYINDLKLIFLDSVNPKLQLPCFYQPKVYRYIMYMYTTMGTEWLCLRRSCAVCYKGDRVVVSKKVMCCVLQGGQSGVVVPCTHVLQKRNIGLCDFM